MAMSNKLKEILAFLALGAVYLLCSVRYFPGRWLDTLTATLDHILSLGLYTIGGTLVIASILQKMAGERLPWRSVLRVFLTISIVIELFIGIAMHVSPK